MTLNPSGNFEYMNPCPVTVYIFLLWSWLRDPCPSCCWWPGAHMALAHLQLRVTHSACYQVIWTCCHGLLLCVWSSNVWCTCMSFQFHYRGSSHITAPMASYFSPWRWSSPALSVPHRGSKRWNRHQCGEGLGRCSSSSASRGGEWTDGQAFYPYEKQGSYSYPVFTGLESHDSMKTVITRIWTIACHDFMWKCVF